VSDINRNVFRLEFGPAVGGKLEAEIIKTVASGPDYHTLYKYYIPVAEKSKFVCAAGCCKL
jgi:hypothetical protein